MVLDSSLIVLSIRRYESRVSCALQETPQHFDVVAIEKEAFSRPTYIYIYI